MGCGASNASQPMGAPSGAEFGGEKAPLALGAETVKQDDGQAAVQAETGWQGADQIILADPNVGNAEKAHMEIVQSPSKRSLKGASSPTSRAVASAHAEDRGPDSPTSQPRRLRRTSTFSQLLEKCTTTKLFAKHGLSRRTIFKLRMRLLLRQDIEIGGKLGEGACGDVFAATVCNDEAAIKTIRSSLASASGPQELHDLMEELRVLADGLDHPNIVQFKGVCVDGDLVLLVCELMHGGSLEDLFAAGPSKGLRGLLSRRPMPQTVKWCKDLVSAIAFLHSKEPPMVHRDLKPANLLLSADHSTLKLTDFGLTRRVTGASDPPTLPSMPRATSLGSIGDASSNAPASPHATAAPSLEDEFDCEAPMQVASPTNRRRPALGARQKRGSMTKIAGTYRYMAPEMAKGDGRYCEKVDVYACALIMWSMVEGRRPWESLDGEGAMITAMGGSRPAMGGREWPAEMVAIIARAWEQDPALRSSASEVLQALSDFSPRASLLSSLSTRRLGSSSTRNLNAAGRSLSFRASAKRAASARNVLGA